MMLDAYTIKKVLPRLVAAAILINLSYYIVMIALDISNVVGHGIGQLIPSAFGIQGNVFDLSTTSGTAQATAAGIGGAGALTALTVLTFHYIGASSAGAFASSAMSVLWNVVLLPLLLIFIAIMVTLIIRLALIVLLLLFSPIAFAFYTLPNTEAYFKRWWKLLYETLLVFPIISALFGLSKVMAQSTIWAVGDKGAMGGFAIILSVLMLVAPLAAIPFAFKIAGGIIGQIHDFVQGARSKAHQSGFLKRGREKALQKAGLQMANGRSLTASRLGNTRFGKGLQRNRITGSLARRTIEGADQHSRMLAAELAKDSRSAAIQDDDHALRAQTFENAQEAYGGVSAYLKKYYPSMSAAEVDAEAKRAVAAAQAATGFGHAQAVNAMQRMIDTGTAVKDIQDEAELIARASGGNSSTVAGLAGYANAKTKQTGRHDLAPSFSTLNTLAQSESLKQRGAGAGPAVADYDAAAENAWNSASLYQHANNKPQDIEAAIKHFTPLLTAVDAAGNPDADAREKAAIFFNELKAMQPNASGDVKNKIDEALTTQQAQIQGAVASLASGPASPTQGIVVRDPTAPLVQNPTTGEFERPVVAVRGETAQERIERKSRTYERIDPNKMQ